MYKFFLLFVRVRIFEFFIFNLLVLEKNFEFIRGIEIWRLRYFKESVVWGFNLFLYSYGIRDICVLNIDVKLLFRYKCIFCRKFLF